MKRLFCLAALLALASVAPICHAQTGIPEEVQKIGETGPKDLKEPAMIWKWANFVLLAAGLGYLIAKNAPAFFAARSEHISRDITEAQKLYKEAELHAAEIDRKMAHLEADLAVLRAESEAEVAAETERQRQRTAAEIVKIQEHARHEIETAGKAARADLRRYATELAIQLAETKIRARMTPETQDSLVRGFIRDLEPPHSEAQGN